MRKPAEGSAPSHRRRLGPAAAFLGVAVGVVTASPLPAQEAATLLTGTDVRVSADTAAPYVEPSLAASPVDPDHLVGASIKVDTAGMLVVAVSSRDGGRSWREVPAEPCGWDPWIAFLPSGTALLACQQPFSEAVLVLRSKDGGATWEGPTEIPPDRREFDHPTIVVDHTDGPNRGSVYVVTGESVRSPSGRVSLLAPAVATSRDGGLTFSPPVRLRATNAWTMVGSPVVTPDGRLGFTSSDYAVDYRQAGGFRTLETQRVWWVESRDGARTLSAPFLVDETKARHWSRVAVDASDGPFAGRLYVTYPDLRDGLGEIHVSRSTDGGETWYDGVRVGSPFRQDDGLDFRIPAVAVNGRGEVLVTWLANGKEPGASCGRLVASASVDGGETFLPPVPVADVASCSAGSRNVVEQPRRGRFDAAERWPQGGDYFGLAALPDDAFHVLWADNRTGVLQLWTDRVGVARTAGGSEHDRP